MILNVNIVKMEFCIEGPQWPYFVLYMYYDTSYSITFENEVTMTVDWNVEVR